MRHNISNFLKQYAFMLALAAMFVGFSAFKASESKLQTNYYKLVGSEYRMVDYDSGECEPETTNTCLWIIESDDLTIPVGQASNPQPHGEGNFNGEFATE